MNTADTLTKMQQMRLLGMAEAFQTRLQVGLKNNFTSEELIAFLVQAEWQDRRQRKIDRHLNAAHFRYNAALEEINYQASRNLDKNLILRLAECQYILEKQNIIIEGATGTGKSFLASALGHQACIKGYKVLYFHTHKLFAKLKMARADHSYHKEINRIEKHDLLILDDFGLHPFDAHTNLMLMEIMEDRHDKKATIITSQFPVNKWHDIIGDHTIADAVLDRILHHAHRFNLKGDSLRKNKKTTVNN